jgi:hypothetical protein
LEKEMAKPLISDELWEIIEPLLPPPKPRRFRYPSGQLTLNGPWQAARMVALSASS